MPNQKLDPAGQFHQATPRLPLKGWTDLFAQYPWSADDAEYYGDADEICGEYAGQLYHDSESNARIFNCQRVVLLSDPVYSIDYEWTGAWTAEKAHSVWPTLSVSAHISELMQSRVCR